MESPRRFSPVDMRRIMSPIRFYFRPEFIGLDSLDLSRPALFVGNHTRYGGLDVPFMIEHLNVQHGVSIRSLGDSFHFNVPLWRDCLIKGGVVKGSPENCDALMEAGESILVFPGGAREVMRRKGEEYTLIWKRRLGFVRQAIKHGYDIIPFGSLGPDECFKVLTDANDIQSLPGWNTFVEWAGLQDLLRGGDIIPPIGIGLGPTPIPRPQRFYFGYGERIPTAHLKGREQDESVLWEVREQVADAIRRQLEVLAGHREVDRATGWSWLRRKFTA